MSQSKSKKTTTTSTEKSSINPVGQTARAKSAKPVGEVTYGMNQFKWSFIGIGCIALGLFLMSGGAMPSPDVWDESIIYSPVKILIAPILIIIGLVLQLFAIFKV